MSQSLSPSPMTSGIQGKWPISASSRESYQWSDGSRASSNSLPFSYNYMYGQLGTSILTTRLKRLPSGNNSGETFLLSRQANASVDWTNLESSDNPFFSRLSRHRRQRQTTIISHYVFELSKWYFGNCVKGGRSPYLRYGNFISAFMRTLR